MNSTQAKNTATALVLALIMIPGLAFAVEDTSILDNTSTTGDASNYTAAEDTSMLDNTDTTGGGTSFAVAEDTSVLDNTGTTGNGTNSTTATPNPVVTTPPADNGGGSGGGSSSGSSHQPETTGGSRSGGSSTVPLTISPLYIVRTGANTFWVAFTTSQSVEGEVLYGTRANSDYENATSFDGASITHSFTITLDPTIINYLRPIARIGTTLYNGTETVLAPTDETIANGATFVPTTEVTTPDETGSTTDTVGSDASTTASTTVGDNTASVSNAFFGAIGNFFQRMWNYLTRSMCELPS